MKPSSAEVLTLLRAHPGGVTSKVAWTEIGCSRLAARVCDLRDAGFDVRSRIVTDRSGRRTVHIALYWLVERPRQLAWAEMLRADIDDEIELDMI